MGREKIQGRIKLEAPYQLKRGAYPGLVHGNVIRLRYTDPVTRLNLRPERICAMKFLFRILRRLVGYLLGVLLVALIAAAATFGWQGYKLYQSAVQATRYGQVIASSLYIRTGAGTNYDKAGSLKNGAIVTITGETNGWYKISSGYVSSDYVSIVDEATAKAAQAAAANTSNGQKMAEFALKYVGYPYVYGGSSPKGFDCSGFVKYVCNQFGYNVNRTASAQMDNGTSVSRDQLQPGDLVFFRKSGSSSRASHVGIYVGGGKFVHASTSKVGVIVSGMNEAYYTSGFVGARRLG